MFLTIVVVDNVLDRTVHMGTNREEEEKIFIDTCRSEIVGWSQFTEDYVEAILDDGYVVCGSKSIMFLDLTDTDGYQPSS